MNTSNPIQEYTYSDVLKPGDKAVVLATKWGYETPSHEGRGHALEIYSVCAIDEVGDTGDGLFNVSGIYLHFNTPIEQVLHKTQLQPLPIPYRFLDGE